MRPVSDKTGMDDLEPVSLAEIKEFLSLEHGDGSRDDLLTSALIVARERLEHHTGRILTNREVTASFRLGQRLPCPIRSVNELTYADYNGNDVEVPIGAVRFNPDGYIAPTFSIPPGTHLKARYMAGYDVGDVPEAVRLAIKMAVRNVHENPNEDPVTPAVLSIVRHLKGENI